MVSQTHTDGYPCLDEMPWESWVACSPPCSPQLIPVTHSVVPTLCSLQPFCLHHKAPECFNCALTEFFFGRGGTGVWVICPEAAPVCHFRLNAPPSSPPAPHSNTCTHPAADDPVGPLSAHTGCEHAQIYRPSFLPPHHRPHYPPHPWAVKSPLICGSIRWTWCPGLELWLHLTLVLQAEGCQALNETKEKTNHLFPGSV